MDCQPTIVDTLTACPMCGMDLPGPILLTEDGDHLIQLDDNDYDQVFFTDQGLLRLHPMEECPYCFNIETLHSHD